RNFLLTYRCDQTFLREPAALNLIADALLKLGGEDERQLLSFVGNDNHTLVPLRTYLKTALKQAKAKTSQKEAKNTSKDAKDLSDGKKAMSSSEK
ncbi:MAG: hypothetical protein V1754_01625, partial [Pseudomonadota bacterium]